MKHAESAKQIGSIEEANLFATKATELMMEYNLSLDQIPLENLEQEMFDKWTYAEKISYSCNQSGNRWKLNLIKTLTYFNFCSFTYNTYSKTFKIYGKMENVDVVIWQYNFLTIGLLRIAQVAHTELSDVEKRQTLRYSFLKDFLLGAVVGLTQQLAEQRKKHESESLTGLMLYNAEALEKFIGTQDENLVKARKQKTIYVSGAYDDGVEAGQNYSITRPIESKEPKPLKRLEQ